ncbi:DNA-binding protein [Phaeobacter gallaeciensis]|uniref:DNA-binding protein n=1 Tax=Phaeobacter gallaeciensis TaxID=60890 RepID=UPI00237EF9CF|nr:DNA-binding protein [Phaeobacter gallaeciensis]MDE4063808.1 DNA-binding protein [Phaeobacter gallaeciensis]MDE4126838.1 DNA-binding protein [Phaeobacter gallaeciensis]MDE4130697.1 DNA-binding protein [Phaeobacter gallaeciensis]
MKASYEDLRTVKQLVEEAPFLTEQKLRWYIFNAESNGLASAIVKISNRVYIDRRAFESWVESQRMAPLN